MKKTGTSEPITSVLDPQKEEAQQICSGCGKPMGKISKEAFKKGEPSKDTCGVCGRSN